MEKQAQAMLPLRSPRRVIPFSINILTESRNDSRKFGNFI
jgi:hypothetical protein